MYGFEIMSELHLTSEQMTANKRDFSTIFVKALNDDSIHVQTAALKAITAFLSGIDDQDVVMEFEPILPLLIQTVQRALEDDEDNGRQALDSLSELTGAHPEVWKNRTDTLLETVITVVNLKKFEAGTRSAAIEVVLSLSEEMPAALRKSALTNQFFAELTLMLTEVEEDQVEWSSSIESKDNFGTDTYSTAMNAITRFSKDIGEKKTLEANIKSGVIQKIQSANWIDR